MTLGALATRLGWERAEVQEAMIGMMRDGHDLKHTRVSYPIGFLSSGHIVNVGYFKTLLICDGGNTPSSSQGCAFKATPMTGWGVFKEGRDHLQTADQ